MVVPVRPRLVLAEHLHAADRAARLADAAAVAPIAGEEDLAEEEAPEEQISHRDGQHGEAGDDVVKEPDRREMAAPRDQVAGELLDGGARLAEHEGDGLRAEGRVDLDPVGGHVEAEQATDGIALEGEHEGDEQGGRPREARRRPGAQLGAGAGGDDEGVITAPAGHAIGELDGQPGRGEPMGGHGEAHEERARLRELALRRGRVHGHDLAGHARGAGRLRGPAGGAMRVAGAAHHVDDAPLRSCLSRRLDIGHVIPPITRARSSSHDAAKDPGRWGARAIYSFGGSLLTFNARSSRNRARPGRDRAHRASRGRPKRR